MREQAGERSTLVTLSGDAEPLRAAFNEHAHTTRLLFLLSPTSRMCRHGASVMQTAVLDAVKAPLIRAYVAWVPMLATDRCGPDGETLSLLSDERAAHFWDAESRLPRLFAGVLGLPEGYPVWDVYLMYAPGPTWENEPPVPLYWQHQLPGVTAPRLDGETFAGYLRLTVDATG